MTQKNEISVILPTIPVRIKLISEDAVIPQRAIPGSVAYDLYCPKDFILQPGRNVVPLGIALEMPPCIEGKVEARSGYSTNGFAIENPPIVENGIVKVEAYVTRIDADVITGKIDSDFRNEIGVIVRNNEKTAHCIRRYQRIAQLTFYRVETADFQLSDSLSTTQRGNGGFGHTGI